ncbi:MAG: glycoside hydrolase family 36 protein, partial [Tepidisphaeraceae bacterium]
MLNMKPACWVMSCMLAFGAAGETMVIHSDRLEVKCDPAAGTFTIGQRGADRPFVSGGRLAGQGGQGKVAEVVDNTFGKGSSIEVRHLDGRVDRISLFDGVPFTVFGSTLRNGAAEMVVVNHVGLAEFDLDLGRPVAELRVLGTGGLSEFGKSAPGSYMWQVVADPQTRRGVVGGWLSAERGSGVLFPDVGGGVARINARLEHGRLQLPVGNEAVLDSFVIGVFDDARLGMEAWADVVAKVQNIHLPPQPSGYCTWYHAGAWNEKGIARQAEFAERNLKPWGFSVVQIDDGWQDGQTKNGPRKNFTRVRENGPYKLGMKETADRIKAAGLLPGIWLMPFSGSPEDPWYEGHRDWFVKQADGKPHESPWGGACLDMTHPGARAYVRDEIKHIVKDWGYQYLKMDGLCSGAGVRHVYVNDGYRDDKMGDAVFYDPAKTNIEAFRDGLRLVREAAGADVYLLGCTVAQNMRAYGGGMGLVDAMRIGPDNNSAWKAIPTGPRYGTRNYHLNGRIWHNDPDCIYARPGVPMNQAQLLATWVTLSGQLGLSSEEFSRLPPERLDLLRRTMPAHGLAARPVDLFEREMPRIWMV